MARHGENIRRRDDGRWEGRYKAFDEKKKKYIYRSLYGKDYEEVKEKLFNIKLGFAPQSLEEKTMPDRYGDNIPKSTNKNCNAILFSQAAEEWLKQISGKRKYSTYIKYDTIYRKHLAEIIGPYQFSTDKTQKLQEKIFDHLLREEMSESLQKSVICVINQIFIFVNEKYSFNIPLLEASSAKAKKKAVKTFSRSEQAKLFDYIYKRRDKYMVAVLLCLYTGLRLGELCALQWKDIDFEGMTLTVNRIVQRLAVQGHRAKTSLLETDPKSESSKRTIPLTPEVQGLLFQLKRDQPYVFGTDKSLDSRTMQYRFKKILKEAGIDARNFHILRHTFATNCVENGMDAKTLSELLGHSNVKITLNRYVHPTMELKRKQLSILSNFYGQICG